MIKTAANSNRSIRPDALEQNNDNNTNYVGVLLWTVVHYSINNNLLNSQHFDCEITDRGATTY